MDFSFSGFYTNQHHYFHPPKLTMGANMMPGAALCGLQQAPTHPSQFVQISYKVTPLLLLFREKTVHEYHSQYQAISNHFCNSPCSQLHAAMVCISPDSYPTLDFECTAMRNVEFLPDLASTSNTASHCPVVICLHTSTGSLHNK